MIGAANLQVWQLSLTSGSQWKKGFYKIEISQQLAVIYIGKDILAVDLIIAKRKNKTKQNYIKRITLG